MNKNRFSRLTFAVAATAALATGLVACSQETASLTPAADSSPAAASPAAEVNSDTVLTSKRLSVSAAAQAAEAALAQCQADGLGFVTVAVVDRNGQLQALLRGDNAAEHTLEAARQKAYTAAAFGANTSELTERAKGDGATIRDLPGTLFLAGGVSVKAGGGSIAGIGVGGAPQGTADEACAAAGLTAISSGLSE